MPLKSCKPQCFWSLPIETVSYSGDYTCMIGLDKTSKDTCLVLGYGVTKEDAEKNALFSLQMLYNQIGKVLEDNKTKLEGEQDVGSKP